MHSFTDKASREWQLHINVAAMRRAQAAGVDLSMPVRKLQEYFFDDCYLCDALWSVIATDAKCICTKEQFEESLDGTIIDVARDALFAALASYFDPKKKQMLLEAIALVKKEMDSLTLNGSQESKAS